MKFELMKFNYLIKLDKQITWLCKCLWFKSCLPHMHEDEVWEDKMKTVVVESIKPNKCRRSMVGIF